MTERKYTIVEQLQTGTAYVSDNLMNFSSPVENTIIGQISSDDRAITFFLRKQPELWTKRHTLDAVVCIVGYLIGR